ncbi:hypothetical protein [Beijerinckia sp. L45]|uniref:hypothetical protein n=1 Tax=Beijerinckia sp. L45 TaxID=1641855 RepID=UPI00131BBA76|nr:hypothetical protein [Beijerinckia sp. L45]
MRRFSYLVLVTAASLGAIATVAEAFPAGNTTLRQDWARVFSRFSPNFGIVEPGECILVRQEIVDGSNRVHLRLVRVCD